MQLRLNYSNDPWMTTNGKPGIGLYDMSNAVIGSAQGVFLTGEERTRGLILIRDAINRELYEQDKSFRYRIAHMFNTANVIVTVQAANGECLTVPIERNKNSIILDLPDKTKTYRVTIFTVADNSHYVRIVKGPLA